MLLPPRSAVAERSVTPLWIVGVVSELGKNHRGVALSIPTAVHGPQPNSIARSARAFYGAIMFKRHRRIFLMMAGVGAIGGLVVAGVICYVVPKKYESEAIIEVKPQNWPGGMPSQTFVTEFEKIKSCDALEKVVDHLDLTRKWNMDRETAIRILKDIVSTRNIRGTDLISIKVRYTDKTNARDITAEVVRQYQKYREDIRSKKADLKFQEFREFNKAVRGQEHKVEELRKALVTTSGHVRKNIQVDGTETLLHLPENQDEANARREFETAQAELQQMKLKQSETLIIHDGPGSAQLIEVHDEPQMAESPVSPNVPLILLLGTAIGFLLSSLLSLPVIRNGGAA